MFYLPKYKCYNSFSNCYIRFQYGTGNVTPHVGPTCNVSMPRQKVVPTSGTHSTSACGTHMPRQHADVAHLGPQWAPIFKKTCDTLR